jgi:tripartite-type tricarboxylate transporter receptor subunit TctC
MALLLAPQDARAYPDRPIKMVLPAAAGSPPDMMVRLLSDKVAAALRQPVIVENKPGAGGTIGARSVMTAEPDGYTLLVGSTSTLLIAPAIYKNAGYDVSAFAPIAHVSDTAEMLGVYPTVPVNSVADLVALAKAQPGKLDYASAGIGTLPHIEGELLKSQARIDINHVPYRGGGQALTGLLAGQVQLLFSALTQVLPHVREGRLKGLAVSSEKRSPLAPDIPTMVESGFDQYITTSITVIAAPAGTPMAIRQRVNEAVAAAVTSSDVQQAYAKLGAQARPLSPEALAADLARQQQRWRRIIETTKVSVD